MTSTTHTFPTWGSPPASDVPTWAQRVGEWGLDVDGSADRTISGEQQILHTFDPSDHGQITVEAIRYQLRSPERRTTSTDTVQVTVHGDCLNLSPAAARNLASMLEYAAHQIEAGK